MAPKVPGNRLGTVTIALNQRYCSKVERKQEMRGWIPPIDWRLCREKIEPVPRFKKILVYERALINRRIDNRQLLGGNSGRKRDISVLNHDLLAALRHHH